jgi:hypothetical protein
MKLRIRGNHLRLRLNRDEVERVAAGEPVEETIAFATQRLSYTAYADRAARALTADLADNRITVAIPEAMATRWASTDEVTLAATVGALTLVVEKDFACLKPREGEDDSRAFPNPNEGSTC